MITVDVDDRAVLDALGELQERVSDPRPALEEIGAEITSQIQGLFKDSEDPWGNPWKTLADSTQAASRGKRAGGQPLLDTGEMRNSIDYQADADGVTIYSNDVPGKVATHQFGGYSKLFKAPIPARPFFPIRGGRADLPEDWQRSAVDIVATYIGGGS